MRISPSSLTSQLPQLLKNYLTVSKSFQHDHSTRSNLVFASQEITAFLIDHSELNRQYGCNSNYSNLEEQKKLETSLKNALEVELIQLDEGTLETLKNSPLSINLTTTLPIDNLETSEIIKKNYFIEALSNAISDTLDRKKQPSKKILNEEDKKILSSIINEAFPIPEEKDSTKKSKKDSEKRELQALQSSQPPKDTKNIPYISTVRIRRNRHKLPQPQITPQSIVQTELEKLSNEELKKVHTILKIFLDTIKEHLDPIHIKQTQKVIYKRNKLNSLINTFPKTQETLTSQQLRACNNEFKEIFKDKEMTKSRRGLIYLLTLGIGYLVAVIKSRFFSSNKAWNLGLRSHTDFFAKRWQKTVDEHPNIFKEPSQQILVH